MRQVLTYTFCGERLAGLDMALKFALIGDGVGVERHFEVGFDMYAMVLISSY